MGRITAIAAPALCSLIVGLAVGGASSFAEEPGDRGLRQPTELLSVEDAGYAEVTDAELLVEPFETSEMFSHRVVGQEMGEPPIVDETFSSVGCGDECDCCGSADLRWHHHGGGWLFDVGVSALQSQMAVADNDAWPDEFDPATRISLGYEWPNQIGMRAQVWAYFLDANISDQTSLLSYNYYWYGSYPYYYYYSPYATTYTNNRRFKLEAATAYLDLYRSMRSRNGELTIGMGPAYGHLQFEFEPAGYKNTYNGGGITVFGDGYYPFVRRQRWELAAAGQARIALLTGNWEVSGSTEDTEHSENMSILDLGVGPEFRFRFGRNAERYWSVQTLAEFQQWRSDRMGPMAGDTLGLQGASVNFGVLW